MRGSAWSFAAGNPVEASGQVPDRTPEEPVEYLPSRQSDRQPRHVRQITLSRVLLHCQGKSSEMVAVAVSYATAVRAVGRSADSIQR
jgi:hypothetical protein